MRITRDEFHGLTKLTKKDKPDADPKTPAESVTSSESVAPSEPPLNPSTDLSKHNHNKTMKLSDSEIRKQLAILAEETINQLSDPNKLLKDVEDIYLIFQGQMMVINKCHLLSVSEQQEQNAKVYACYYKKKFELKKLEFKKKN
ncbi:hypothetical protein [Acetobacterium woodii]|uniref:hypothetical protein n=1 Tax=Acetobacterium woodii TaxID=33952 RepID=UPI0002D8F1B7|nr:hypothetical protein [Acetobacterium woodii]